MAGLMLLLAVAVGQSPPGAPSPRADVDRLVRAAERLTSTWPLQPPPAIREVALVARHGRVATPLLVALLSDDPAAEHDPIRWRVQQQVTLALSQIYSEAPQCGRVYCDGSSAERIRNVKRGWRQQIARDTELQSLSVDELLAGFSRETTFWRQRDIARVLIAKADGRVIPRLESGLTLADRHLRGNVALVLAGLGDPRGFPAIVNILSDRSPRPEAQGHVAGKWTLAAQIRSDRYYAAHLLGELKDPRAVDVLVPLLWDRDIGSIVPWSLAQIGDRRAVPPLIQLLENDDPSVRVLAILALEQLHATEALPQLQTLLTDGRASNFGDPITVGAAAKRAIVTISGSAQ